MKCPRCQAPMELLFTSAVCSKDCDKTPQPRIVKHAQAMQALREGATIRYAVRAQWMTYRYEPATQKFFAATNYEPKEVEMPVSSVQDLFRAFKVVPKDTQWEILN